jgi:8-oxo-dGTP diphosphatase
MVRVTSERAGVAIFFVNRRGEVLLRLRGDEPGLAFPNQWDTIGGAIEAGEAHAEAAVRETAEEIGVELQGQVYWREYQSVVLLHIYAAPLDVTAEDLVLTEGRRIAWFGLEEALREPLHAWVRAMLPEFMASEVCRAMVSSGFGRASGR